MIHTKDQNPVHFAVIAWRIVAALNPKENPMTTTTNQQPTPDYVYEIAACTYTADKRFLNDRAFREVVDAVYRVARDAAGNDVAAYADRIRRDASTLSARVAYGDIAAESARIAREGITAAELD